MPDFHTDHEISVIVGLGNPGGKYVQTRHNIGFRILDRLAADKPVSFKGGSPDYEIADFRVKSRNIRLIKPMTYMNNSGIAVAHIVRYYKIAPEEILVVCDDVNLPLGKIRVRSGGSDGGHNGLKSIIENLDDRDFPRVRIGVGPQPEKMALEDFVLAKFSQEENVVLDKLIDKTAEIIYGIINQGIQRKIATYKIEEDNKQ
ncbi:MAG: aminoacyl-tRNA hydrolase [candidate division Zixibacteria bacterium]|nr:aminoacyl-tRNA hydrolase [candidate division Zixibacteria bacterium]